MLTPLADLSPFFEDCYRRIHVREYARIRKISPPTASKVLENYRKEGLLNKVIDKRHFCYHANRENVYFVDFMRIYWRYALERIHFFEILEKEFIAPVIILFGSLSKGEATPSSDVDVVVFATTKKQIDLTVFEKQLGREIQLFVFPSRDAVDNKNLLNNILSGYLLHGHW